MATSHGYVKTETSFLVLHQAKPQFVKKLLSSFRSSATVKVIYWSNPRMINQWSSFLLRAQQSAWITIPGFIPLSLSTPTFNGFILVPFSILSAHSVKIHRLCCQPTNKNTKQLDGLNITCTAESTNERQRGRSGADLLCSSCPEQWGHLLKHLKSSSLWL